jgi:two-component system sensor histidine kinase ChvG
MALEGDQTRMAALAERALRVSRGLSRGAPGVAGSRCTSHGFETDSAQSSASEGNLASLSVVHSFPRRVWRSVVVFADILRRWGSVVLRRLANTWTGQFISANLRRRIIASNLFGFGILLLGLLYLSIQHPWLTEAKITSLREQGEIIARVVASNATLDNERIAIDPDRLPEIGDSRIPFRNDAFTALELSIRPERVAPLLRRLLQQTNNRARIYGRDGTLIVDTAQLLQKGEVLKPPVPQDGRPKTRNFWTRLAQWIKGSELSVYREIGAANGTAYREVRDALQGRQREMLLLAEEGELMVSVTVPIQRAGAVHGVLLLSTRPGEIDEIVGEERMALLILSLIGLLTSIAVSLLLARTVAGPMQKLAAAAERASSDIKAGRDLPDYPDRRDEIGSMASAFRAMTATLFRRIEASEKFAADVAHELKNPLTAARSTAESLDYARTDEQRRQLVTQIQSELKRLNRLITDVSNASRLDAELALQQRDPVDVTVLLERLVSSFGDLLRESGRRIELNIEKSSVRDPFTVLGHEGRIAQVATNLIDNAISFSPPEGVVTVGLRRDGERVEFSVRDQGPGVDTAALEKVFERFYTYRPTAESSRGNNSGLGLSISREIVTAHGGRVWAENILETKPSGETRRAGARFVVSLPALTSSRRL